MNKPGGDVDTPVSVNAPVPERPANAAQNASVSS